MRQYESLVRPSRVLWEYVIVSSPLLAAMRVCCCLVCESLSPLAHRYEGVLLLGM